MWKKAFQIATACAKLRSTKSMAGGQLTMSGGAAPARFSQTEAFKGLRLISPTLLYCLIVMAAPLLTVVLYAFMTDTVSETGQKIVAWPLTFENMVTVWTGKVYQTIMARSLMVSMLVTLATVLLAFPVAYYVSFYVPAHRKSLWLFLITIPFWTSYVVRVFLWKVILGYNGVINSGLLSTGIISEPLQAINYNVGALVMTLAHAYAPFAILPIFVVLEKIDRSLLEAGQDLGESRIMTFLRVTLPLSVPGIIAAVLIVFIPTVGDYVTPDLIGGGKLPMIANMIEVQMLKQNNRALGSAIAVSAMLIVAAVSIIFVLLNRRYLKGASR
jgi:spermidine/putrescine transport system permease protein